MIGVLTSAWLIGPVAVVCCTVLLVLTAGEATMTGSAVRLRLAAYGLVVVLVALIALRFFHLVQRGTSS